jgi:hypothetical protein
MNLDKQLDRMVSGFVGDLRKVISQATREQVADALRRAVGGRGAANGARGGRVAKVARGGRGGRIKRSPKQIAAQTSKLHDYIKSHPGERMELISRSLGLTTNLLQPLIKKLLSDKKIKAKGKARGTTYTVS